MLILAGYYFYLFLALLSPFSSGTRMFHNPHENLVEKKIGGAERVTASYSTSRKKANEFAPSRLKYNHIHHLQCSPYHKFIVILTTTLKEILQVN